MSRLVGEQIRQNGVGIEYGGLSFDKSTTDWKRMRDEEKLNNSPHAARPSAIDQSQRSGAQYNFFFLVRMFISFFKQLHSWFANICYILGILVRFLQLSNACFLFYCWKSLNELRMLDLSPMLPSSHTHCPQQSLASYALVELGEYYNLSSGIISLPKIHQ